MISRVVRESTPPGNWRSERHTSESSPGHRGRSDHNRCSHVRREEGLTPVPSGEAVQGRGSGENSPRASFPIWSTI